ncbi:MAG: proline dehydrogenase family protein, partial [Deltaproteobacteria bacterium]|nr:proline dehydrogenase family protein [Deltaproteobacteria bacterium]
MKETNQTEDSNSPVCFEDTATAFKHKSNRELLLSYLIFGLTKSPFLVKFLSQAAKFALAIGLPVKPFIKATVFKQFCGGEKKEEYSKVITELGKSDVGTILDYSVEGTKDEDGFEDTTKQLLQIIEQSKSDPNIPCTCMKMTAIGSFDLFKKVSANETLAKEDQLDLNKVKIRLEKICNASKEADKPIYIDAEETWIQGAIDGLAEEMMAKYNQNRAIVFTTLQLYRWDRNDYFKQLILQARSGGYKLGIKIVRGAYLEKERERARRLRYKSPINDTKADTDREYNRSVEIFIDNIDVVEICVGTHNEESCKLLIQTMAEMELP